MVVLLWQLWGVGPARVEGEGERGVTPGLEQQGQRVAGYGHGASHPSNVYAATVAHARR